LTRMRRGIPLVAAGLILAGPTVLAFFTGGYFSQPRLVAAIVAWLMVAVMAVAGPVPLPRGLSGWLTVGGLVALTAWSALSVTWAPLRGPAVEDVERLLLYLGVLLLAIGALRPARALRAVEPALAAGVTIVICYGLSGRLLPGIIHLAQSLHAGGRLEQPITYWNAEGALSGVGFVLCARLAGDRTRSLLVRALAAAAAAPLGAGVYLSYSRGAIAATCVGLVLLLAAAPTRSQLKAIVVTLVAGMGSAVLSSVFRGVASQGGDMAARERDGAIMLALLVLLAAVAALAIWRIGAAERAGGSPDIRLPGARWLGTVAAAAVALVAAGLVFGGLHEKAGTGNHETTTAKRLTSVDSNRYAYWRVGLRAFRRHPIDGLGAAGFRVFWLRERPVREGVLNPHSIELETAAELGIVGLLALGVTFGGVGLAARQALRRNAPMAAGWCAAGFVWLMHTSIDWDWEIPAVSLPAIVLAGALVALAEAPPDAIAAPPERRTKPGGVPVTAEVEAQGGAVPAR
jgi:hypothetical protein